MTEAMFVTGTTRVGQGSLRRSIFDPEAMRRMVASDTAPVINVPASKTFMVQDGREVYRLDVDGGGSTGTLSTIDSGSDGQVVVLSIVSPLRVVTITDAVVGIDGNEGFVVHGGDFTLRDGDILALRYRPIFKRWMEVGRVWASEPYVDATAPPTASLHEEYELVMLALDT